MYLNSGLWVHLEMHQNKALFSHDVKCQGLYKSDHTKALQAGYGVTPVPAEGPSV